MRWPSRSFRQPRPRMGLRPPPRPPSTCRRALSVAKPSSGSCAPPWSGYMGGPRGGRSCSTARPTRPTTTFPAPGERPTERKGPPFPFRKEMGNMPRLSTESAGPPIRRSRPPNLPRCSRARALHPTPEPCRQRAGPKTISGSGWGGGKASKRRPRLERPRTTRMRSGPIRGLAGWWQPTVGSPVPGEI